MSDLNGDRRSLHETIASYEELDGDDFIVVGGYESG